jgi:hypothetical protein
MEGMVDRAIQPPSGGRGNSSTTLRLFVSWHLGDERPEKDLILLSARGLRVTIQ